MKVLYLWDHPEVQVVKCPILLPFLFLQCLIMVLNSQQTPTIVKSNLPQKVTKPFYTNKTTFFQWNNVES